MNEQPTWPLLIHSCPTWNLNIHVSQTTTFSPALPFKKMIKVCAVCSVPQISHYPIKCSSCEKFVVYKQTLSFRPLDTTFDLMSHMIIFLPKETARDLDLSHPTNQNHYMVRKKALPEWLNSRNQHSFQSSIPHFDFHYYTHCIQGIVLFSNVIQHLLRLLSAYFFLVIPNVW